MAYLYLLKRELLSYISIVKCNEEEISLNSRKITDKEMKKVYNNYIFREYHQKRVTERRYGYGQEKRLSGRI